MNASKVIDQRTEVPLYYRISEGALHRPSIPFGPHRYCPLCTRVTMLNFGLILLMPQFDAWVGIYGSRRGWKTFGIL
jgi:hypothetical protein